MRRTAALAVAVSLLALSPPPAKAAKKVPAQLALARYVRLGYDTGDRFVSETDAIRAPYDVYPEDRQALVAVREALEKWGKYVITVGSQPADLLIAVRVGRRGAVEGGAPIGGARRGGLGPLGVAGGELSSRDDLFTVYDANGVRLWGQQGQGLFAGSPPKAFEQFRADVESLPEPAKKPTRP